MCVCGQTERDDIARRENDEQTARVLYGMHACGPCTWVALPPRSPQSPPPQHLRSTNGVSKQTTFFDEDYDDDDDSTSPLRSIHLQSIQLSSRTTTYLMVMDDTATTTRCYLLFVWILMVAQLADKFIFTLRTNIGYHLVDCLQFVYKACYFRSIVIAPYCNCLFHATVFWMIYTAIFNSQILVTFPNFSIITLLCVILSNILIIVIYRY